MAEKQQFRAVKGTRDILPPDSALWNWFEQAARDVFETYGFHDIRTPIFEGTELFRRSIGMETDIVNKEMFQLASDLNPLVEDARQKMEHAADTFMRTPDDLNGASEVERAVLFFAGRVEEAASGGNQTLASEDILICRKIAALQEEWKGHLIPAKEYVGQVGLSARALDRRASLRPEATASVARAYIEHGMHTLPGNQKLYYVGPMFRRERPQKGRYRQFYQIGAEVLGQSDAPAIDAEVIEMLMTFFKRARLANTTLYINSIGCRECRPKYAELLSAELRKVKDQLGPDSQRRIETNPLRVLDSKLPEEQPIIEKLPRISDHLCADCRAHFAKLKDELALRHIVYQENWRLVRGLDYYTRTTFEVTAEGLGSQNAVCGGGRYDGLVELLGGPAGVKGIGFAIGTDRAILSLQENKEAPQLPGLAVFIAWMNAQTYPAAVEIARKLRACGLAVELPPEEMKFKKSLGLADKLGARYALIIGEDEVASGAYTLKRLSDGDQRKLRENDLLEYLESERRGSG